MKLVALIGSLSATSEKYRDFNTLILNPGCLSRLSRENKRQAKKKPNEINACRLIALVAPTGNAGADKRRSPWVHFRNLNTIKKPGKGKAITTSRYLMDLFLKSGARHVG